MFNFIQHLFTARALERALKEAEHKIHSLESQLNECKNKNEALHKKIPSAGVTIEPPKQRALMGRSEFRS